MIKLEFFTVFCVLLILYIIIKPKIEETFSNIKKSSPPPDDLFTDGLDHNLGLNKQHRHHSF